jgi:hypothetical protein
MEEQKSQLVTFREHKLPLGVYNCRLQEEKNIYSYEKQEDNSSKAEYPEEQQYEENFLPK